MKELDSKDFEKEVLKSEKPVVIDFWAPWCGPCKMMAPVFENVSRQMPELKFAKVNVDKDPKLAHEYGILSIPCIVVFNKGEEAGRITGLVQEQQLKERIERLL